MFADLKVNNIMTKLVTLHLVSALNQILSLSGKKGRQTKSIPYQSCDETRLTVDKKSQSNNFREKKPANFQPHKAGLFVC